MDAGGGACEVVGVVVEKRELEMAADGKMVELAMQSAPFCVEELWGAAGGGNRRNWV